MEDDTEPLILRIPDLRRRFELARAGERATLSGRATAELLRPSGDRCGQAARPACGDEDRPTERDDEPDRGG